MRKSRNAKDLLVEGKGNGEKGSIRRQNDEQSGIGGEVERAVGESTYFYNGFRYPN